MNWLLIAALISSFLLPQESTPATVLWSLLLVLPLWLRYRNHPELSLPFGALWMSVFASLLLTSIASRSLSASLGTWIRYALAFLVYTYASGWKPVNLTQYALWGSRFFNAIMLIFFLILILQTWIPLYPYNGITTLNGHHPVAYLIVMGLPLLFERYRRTRAKKSIIPIVLAISALLLSGARGAMLLVSLWLLMLVITDRGRQKLRRTISMLLISIIIALFGIHRVSALPYEQKTTLRQHYPKLSVFIKEYPKDDQRVEFIYQAIRGIKHSPFWGNGPGTFPLVSRAFERYPGTYSTHAHSFPMQLLSDQGIIGSIPIFTLLGYIGLTARKLIKSHKNGYMRSLAWGILLSFWYSIFEGNLNGIGPSMLWWGAAGFVMANRSTAGRASVVRLARAQGVILMGYVLSVALSISAIPAPYRKNTALLFIEKGASPQAISTILFFHRRDPDIKFALASRGIDPLHNYQEAISLDPYNYPYWQRALQYYWQQKNTDAETLLLCGLIRHSGQSSYCTISQAEMFPSYLVSPAFGETLGYLQGTDGLSKFYYSLALGLFRETGDTDHAIFFLTLARNNALHWGYYHLELASAYYYWENDVIMAQRVLDDCQRQPLAKHGCSAIATTPDELYAPGIYASDIAAIPAIQ